MITEMMLPVDELIMKDFSVTSRSAQPIRAFINLVFATVVCISNGLHTSVYIYMWIWIHVYMYIIILCTNISVYLSLFVCMYICIYMYLYVYICVYVTGRGARIGTSLVACAGGRGFKPWSSQTNDL